MRVLVFSEKISGISKVLLLDKKTMFKNKKENLKNIIINTKWYKMYFLKVEGLGTIFNLSVKISIWKGKH